jgi:hypothetical protein
MEDAEKTDMTARLHDSSRLLQWLTDTCGAV